MTDFWTGCANEPNSWLKWIECHPASIGAIQAVALFVTVVVAIGVPAYIARRDRKERLRLRNEKTVSLAQSLLGAVFVLSAETHRASKAFQIYSEKPPPEEYISDWFQSIKITIPEELLDSVQFMHECDHEFIDPFRRAAFLSRTHNNYVNMYMQIVHQSLEKSWADVSERISETMASVTQAAREAQATFLKK